MRRQPWWPIKHQRAKPEFARCFFSFSSNMSRIVSCCHSRGTPCPNDPKAVKHRTNWSMMTLEAKLWNDTKWLINGSPIHRWQSDMNSEQEELITQRLKSAWLWLPCLYCVSLLVCSVLKLRIVSWMFALTTNTGGALTCASHFVSLAPLSHLRLSCITCASVFVSLAPTWLVWVYTCPHL